VAAPSIRVNAHLPLKTKEQTQFFIQYFHGTAPIPPLSGFVVPDGRVEAGESLPFREACSTGKVRRMMLLAKSAKYFQMLSSAFDTGRVRT